MIRVHRDLCECVFVFIIDILNTSCCNMNVFFSFGLYMVYIPEWKQQLRTMK
jgi:hypothetical protein